MLQNKHIIYVLFLFLIQCTAAAPQKTNVTTTRIVCNYIHVSVEAASDRWEWNL